MYNKYVFDNRESQERNVGPNVIYIHYYMNLV